MLNTSQHDGKANAMSVTAFQDLPMADRDRDWDGDAAEQRVRKWASAEDGPNEKYRDAHVWYDNDNKDNFGAYKLQGSRGGVDLPKDDIERVKSHLAKYYAKMDDVAPWER